MGYGLHAIPAGILTLSYASSSKHICTQGRVTSWCDGGNLDFDLIFKEEIIGTSLAVQWLRLHTSTAGDTGSIPGWVTKIPRAVQHGQKGGNK